MSSLYSNALHIHQISIQLSTFLDVLEWEICINLQQLHDVITPIWLKN